MAPFKIVSHIILIMSISGILSACQEGHSFSTHYQNGIPAKNSPKKYSSWRHKTQKNNKTIIVKKADTVYALSRRYDVSVRAIIQQNNLKSPYILYPGQKLKTPKAAVYVIQKNDTIYSLSRKYNMDMTSLARLNNMKQPYTLSIGQKLTVPNLSAVRINQKKRTAQIRAYSPLPKSGPSQKENGFIWPLKGPLLSSFGPKDKGYHNDGINISAKFGSYVRASQSGVVVHTGNKIKGFGNLVLIKHNNGWITAYAHNSAILVTKGQLVKRGQSIARVGQSGGVPQPQLHFEIRKAARAVNPKLYITH